MSISYWEEHPTTRVTFPMLAKVVQDQPSTLLPAEDEFLLSADIYVPERRGGGMGDARQGYASVSRSNRI